MAVSQHEARLRLTAYDQTSRAFDSARRQMRQLVQEAAGTSTALDRAAHRSRMAIQGASGSMLAFDRSMRNALVAGGTGYAIARSYKEFANLDRFVTNLAGKLDKTPQQMAGLPDQMRKIAKEAGLPVEQVAAGIDRFATAGGTSFDRIMQIMPAVARTAAVAEADITDVVETARAVGQSFNMDDITLAFDIMAKGANEGAFELRDMARYAPTASTAMQKLGYEGAEGLKVMVAMFEEIRDRSGTSEEAATRVLNVLQKARSDETFRRFKEQGIDIRKEMAAAQDPIARLVQITHDLTKNGVLIEELFGDQEVQQGMLALVEQMGQMQPRINEMGQAANFVLERFARIKEDPVSNINRLMNEFKTLTQEAGRFLDKIGATDALLEFTGILEDLTGILRTLREEWDKPFKQWDWKKLGDMTGTTDWKVNTAEEQRAALHNRANAIIQNRITGAQELAKQARERAAETTDPEEREMLTKRAEFMERAIERMTKAYEDNWQKAWNAMVPFNRLQNPVFMREYTGQRLPGARPRHPGDAEPSVIPGLDRWQKNPTPEWQGREDFLGGGRLFRMSYSPSELGTASENTLGRVDQGIREMTEGIRRVEDAIREGGAGGGYGGGSGYVGGGRYGGGSGYAGGSGPAAGSARGAQEAGMTTSGAYGQGRAPTGEYGQRLAAAITKGAEELQISPEDLATMMSFETAGTFDPWKKGPTTKWGTHRGLIQWGEPQARKYGVGPNTPVEDQVSAAVQFIKDQGFVPGEMSGVNAYAAINAGNANNIYARDRAAGGTPGTVLDKWTQQMGGHRANAQALFGLNAPGGGPNMNTAGGRVTEMQQQAAGVRKYPLASQTRAWLDAASARTGLEAVVTSGGQDDAGRRALNSSHRHDRGGAGDLKLRDPETGRFLDMTNPADRTRMEAFMRESVAAGATGIGAAPNYMGTQTMHIGGGSEATWGKKGEAAPEWVQRAHREGAAMRGMRQAAPPPSDQQIDTMSVQNAVQELKNARDEMERPLKLQAAPPELPPLPKAADQVARRRLERETAAARQDSFGDIGVA